MGLSYLTLTLDLYDGQGNYPVAGTASFAPSAVLTDAGVEVVGQQPVTAAFRAASLPSARLLATDSPGPLPAGWTWGAAFSGITGAPAAFSFFLPASPTSFTATDATPCVLTLGSGSAGAGTAFSNGAGVQLSGGSLPAGFSAGTTYYVVNASGATFQLAAVQGGVALASTSSGSGTVTAVSQLMSNLIPVASGAAFQAYMPLPSGTPQAGQVPVATGSGEVSAWGAAGFQNPMTMLGDLMYENASPAAARLPGDTSGTRKFLRGQAAAGVAQAPVWDTLQAGDVPQLSQYNPVGLTGATAPTSYAGGTVSGHPLSGTWSQGQWVADQTGKIYVCVSGGTPGTWRRVGKDPWQFFLDDYCKGDVTQALVSVTNGSAVISTTPLGAPSAPALANSGSGGTILAGTYQAKITYVNRWGETTASSSASTTTSGSTSTITVTPPNVAGSGNATGWYLYMTQAGGSTYTRQQAPGSPSAMGAPLVLTAPPSSGGANPPGSDTSGAQVFTSTAVDGGKNIMICGALGSPGGPWIDTIASVQSPTQATLSTAGATVTQAGCAMVFSSDDRLNVDQCISDAKAYALASSYLAQVIGSDRGYGLGTGLFQSAASNATGALTYNTQVRVPVPNPSGDTRDLEIHLLGPGDGSYQQFWMSREPNLGPCAFVSYSVGPDSNPDATYGQQSVIGAPEGGAGTGANGFFNTKAVVSGVRVWQPGWSNSIGVDLQFISGCQLRGGSFAFAPASALGGGVNPYSGWPSQSFWVNNKIGAGLRLPTSDNNEHVIVDGWAVGGLNAGVITNGDGIIINDLITVSCDVPVRLDLLGPSFHDLIIRRLYFENCNNGIVNKAGSGAGNFLAVDITMDGENSGLTGYDVKDTANVLTGVIRWSDTARSPAVPAVNSATAVKIINNAISAGHMASPPSVPASGSPSAPVYRDASAVVVHTGAGVTVSAIAVDGVTTGLAIAAASSLSIPPPASGGTVTLTYSGGTPTWDWWLY